MAVEEPERQSPFPQIRLLYILKLCEIGSDAPDDIIERFGWLWGGNRRREDCEPPVALRRHISAFVEESSWQQRQIGVYCRGFYSGDDPLPHVI